MFKKIVTDFSYNEYSWLVAKLRADVHHVHWVEIRHHHFRFVTPSRRKTSCRRILQKVYKGISSLIFSSSHKSVCNRVYGASTIDYNSPTAYLSWSAMIVSWDCLSRSMEHRASINQFKASARFNSTRFSIRVPQKVR